MKRIILIIIMIGAVTQTLSAVDKEREWGIVPIAAPYYTPDTGWGIGAYVVSYIKPDKEAGFSKPDELSFYIVYTEKKQTAFNIRPNIYFRNGAVKLSGEAEIQKYPMLFWGHGPDTGDDAEESYTPVEVWSDMAVLLKLAGSFYLGPMVHLRLSRISDVEDGGIIDTGSIPGSDGTKETGVGLSFQMDTRNSVFYPAEGFFIKGEGLFNRKELSGEYNFSRFEIDARWFCGIAGEHVIALQFKSEIAAGDVTLQSMCGIGGNEIMRGYLKNRYIDKSCVSGQAEYRFPLVWRFAGVVFAAAGEVQDSPADYNCSDIHYSCGFGLRLILDRSQHISARADCGIDEEGKANIYFLAKEAF